ncbi:MAG: MMPL family transporter [Thermoleophilia bacterium]
MAERDHRRPGLHGLAGRIATLPAGRRGKLVVLGVWIAIVAVALVPASRFEDAQRNEQSSFLPEDAESTRALEVLDRFARGDVADAVVVYAREGGLTDADRRAIADDRASLTREPPTGVGQVPEPTFAPEGDAALLSVPIDTGGASDRESLQVLEDAVARIRALAGDGPAGLTALATGGAAFSVDAAKVFDDINRTLLLATAGLVFVLLVLIYRSPIFWILPLLSVGFAELTVRGVGYGLAQAGLVINGQTAGILLVLVFGAGTDYALLLVARYREELRRHEDRHRAVDEAIRRAGPAILASGATNVCALLVLMLATVNATSGLGPVAAMGIGVVLVAMLTVLPALLALTGRRAFWPFVPRFAGEDARGAAEEDGVFRRLGDGVARRSRRVWIGTAAALAVLALGLIAFDGDLTTGNSFRGEVESAQGQELLAASFPGGASAPTDVIVPEPANAAAVASALEDVPGVSSVRELERGAPGVHLAATLEVDPFSTDAFDLVPDLRRAAEAAGGPDVLVGGPTAVEHDLRQASTRDLALLPPIVLAVILTIIGALLRSLVAPIVLAATVILSFAAALGASTFLFDVAFGFPGQDYSLPLYGFIFLVALGVDYNIFLMARAREESAAHGTREGMIRALAVTGSVITAAGIVLAGTFSVLAVLPLVTLTEIGFLVAFGVLLDTFVVRSVLLPALAVDLRSWVWWPSRLNGEARRADQGRRPAAAPARRPAVSRD